MFTLMRSLTSLSLSKYLMLRMLASEVCTMRHAPNARVSYLHAMLEALQMLKDAVGSFHPTPHVQGFFFPTSKIERLMCFQ